MALSSVVRFALAACVRLTTGDLREVQKSRRGHVPSRLDIPDIVQFPYKVGGVYPHFSYKEIIQGV